ncbi:hypothetical protein BDF14DRAFT_1876513 [Spinellus fusiger]|nr:hypothetical protein BDF14DRAFT_1876513 [Spinellus fusiger]
MSSILQESCVVDVHTHVYLERYMELLRSRTTVPYILPPLEKGEDERLIILPGEDENDSTKTGRPVGSAYYSVHEKIKFMDLHGISISVVSLANPWLDFLPPTPHTLSIATEMNQAMEDMCSSEAAQGRLYAFGTLPISSVEGSIEEVKRIAQWPHLRGVIMGTMGCGKGLDDPALVPLFEAIGHYNLVVFLHPHYGLSLPGSDTNDVGHSLALALGFPFETTHAVSRLILSGIFDRLPNLKLLLAHAGGTLPFLAGRLDSCVAHDPHVSSRLKHPPSYYIRKLYCDAVIYHETGVKATADFVDPQNIMFGTDHPFFPPLEKSHGSERWLSVESNFKAITNAGLEESVVRGILGGNAKRLLNLQ